MNIYYPNAREPTFVKETLLELKSYLEPHILIVEDFDTRISPMDRSSRQKLNREIMELADIITQIDLTDTYGTFHQTQKNMPSSQHLMELSVKLIIYSTTKKVSTDTNKMK